MSTDQRGLPRTLRAILLLAGLALAAAPAAAQDDGSYGYFRELEGSATLIQAGSGTRAPVELNQPLLTGDRVLVQRGSRLEVVLPDGNLLRLDGGSEVAFDRLAGSPDADAGQTRLILAEGNVQLVVLADALGEDLPRIDTPNATVYIQNPGAYRLTSDQGTWTSVVVREGSAEVVTERGAVVVRADEEAQVDGDAAGDRWPRASVQAASSRDSLERWGDRLDDEAARLARSESYVDEDLRYAAAPLDRYGRWLTVGGEVYWRPTVEGGWRPYWHGRWIYTPAGLTWLPYEPWGWVPYHYGSWDYLPGYGWAWSPGRRWAPAWVYWYWGSGGYVSWCPTGYYTHYYGLHDPYFGVYGWAGGDWGFFSHWTFVHRDHLGRRDQHRYARRADDVARALREMPRGIITTDTKPLTPERWKDPEGALRALRARRGERELPDVTPFVARKPTLPPGVRDAVAAKPADRPEKGGVPLRPDRGVERPERGERGRPVIRLEGKPEKPEVPRPPETRPSVRPPEDWREREPAEKPRVWDRSPATPRVRPDRPSPPESGGEDARERGSSRPRVVPPERAKPEPAPKARPEERPAPAPRAPEARPEKRPEDKPRVRPEERPEPPPREARSDDRWRGEDRAPRVREAVPERPRSESWRRPEARPEPRVQRPVYVPSRPASPPGDHGRARPAPPPRETPRAAPQPPSRPSVKPAPEPPRHREPRVREKPESKPPRERDRG